MKSLPKLYNFTLLDMINPELQHKIFEIKSDKEFNDISIQIFRYQYKNNNVYRDFVDYLNIKTSQIKYYTDIPFLPIEFFKTHKIYSSNSESQIEFKSSGTTGHNRSSHFIADLQIYERSFLECFKQFYGNPEGLRILALLPSYLEQGNSSLIYMVEQLIKKSRVKESGFYLDASEKLINIINSKKGHTLLIGVTYALLDLAERFDIQNSDLMVMETGGMKGRRKEITREELHQNLTNKLQVDTIHSEYGMTELLSQAYSKGNGLFKTPPWMKILIRDTNDPLSLIQNGKTGGINVIDLANLYSCAFIATQDLGKIKSNGLFEVLGRFDVSDIRGCNLMVD
jgi:phenylacetate-coenzyme A ligase PaaK-like adenylate-forming protein